MANIELRAATNERAEWMRAGRKGARVRIWYLGRVILHSRRLVSHVSRVAFPTPGSLKLLEWHLKSTHRSRFNRWFSRNAFRTFKETSHTRGEMRDKRFGKKGRRMMRQHEFKLQLGHRVTATAIQADDATDSKLASGAVVIHCAEVL